MGKPLGIPLKLNFTPNTLGCYGLMTDVGIWELQTIDKVKEKSKLNSPN